MKCTHCGTEWSMQKNASQSKIFCPGCGKPVSAEPAAKERMDTLEDCLRYLFQKFGAEPFQAGNMLISLHSDLMPQRQKDRRLLTVLVNCNGHTTLLAAKQKAKGEQRIAISRLAKKMEDDWMIKPEIIREVISAFWLAVGGDREVLPAPTPKSQSIPANAVCRPGDYRIFADGTLGNHIGKDPIIRVPDGVKEIGPGAFAKTLMGDAAMYLESAMLKEVYLPEGVYRIQIYAFAGCIALRNIMLRDGLEIIADSAFEGCTALDSITFPDGLRIIGSRAFGWCSALKSVTIPDSLKEIYEYAFVGCNGIQVIASDAWKKAHPDLMCYIEHPPAE